MPASASASGHATAMNVDAFGPTASNGGGGFGESSSAFGGGSPSSSGLGSPTIGQSGGFGATVSCKWHLCAGTNRGMFQPANVPKLNAQGQPTGGNDKFYTISSTYLTVTFSHEELRMADYRKHSISTQNERQHISKLLHNLSSLFGTKESPPVSWESVKRTQSLSQWRCGVCLVQNVDVDATGGPVAACVACEMLKPGFLSLSSSTGDTSERASHANWVPAEPGPIPFESLEYFSEQVQNVQRFHEEFLDAQERLQSACTGGAGITGADTMLPTEMLQNRNDKRRVFVKAATELRSVLDKSGMSNWESSVDRNVLETLLSICTHFVDVVAVARTGSFIIDGTMPTRTGGDWTDVQKLLRVPGGQWRLSKPQGIPIFGVNADESTDPDGFVSDLKPDDSGDSNFSDVIPGVNFCSTPMPVSEMFNSELEAAFLRRTIYGCQVSIVSAFYDNSATFKGFPNLAWQPYATAEHLFRFSPPYALFVDLRNGDESKCQNIKLSVDYLKSNPFSDTADSAGESLSRDCVSALTDNPSMSCTVTVGRKERTIAERIKYEFKLRLGGNVGHGSVNRDRSENKLSCCFICALDVLSQALKCHPNGSRLSIAVSLHLIAILRQLRLFVKDAAMQPVQNVGSTLDRIIAACHAEPESEPEPQPEIGPDVFVFKAASPDPKESAAKTQSVRRSRLRRNVRSGRRSISPTLGQSSVSTTGEAAAPHQKLLDIAAELASTLSNMVAKRQERDAELQKATDEAGALVKACLIKQLDVLDGTMPAAQYTHTETVDVEKALTEAVWREGLHYLTLAQSLEQCGGVVLRLATSAEELRSSAVQLATQASALVDEAQNVQGAGEQPSTQTLGKLKLRQKAVRKTINRAEFDAKEAVLDEDADAGATARAQLAEARREAVRIEREIADEKSQMVRMARDYFPELRAVYPAIAEELDLGSNMLFCDGRRKAHYDEMSKLPGGRHQCWTARYGDEKVVLKEFNLGKACDRRMYEREFQFQERLRHPRLLRLQASFSEDLCIYAQYPYITAGNMRHWLMSSDTHSESAVMKVCYEVLVGLNYLHSKEPPVLHCDLKQENVLIDADGLPLIADFETSKEMVADVSVSMAGGTLGYLAPELTTGTGRPSRASDVFAFGVLWLNAIERPADGRYPLRNSAGFTGVQDRVKRLQFEGLLNRLLSPRPETRPSTTQLLADRVLIELKGSSTTGSETKYPLTWEAMQTPQQNYKLVTLPPGCEEYKEVSGSFLHSAAGKRIKRIERVQNKFLWEAFLSQRAALTRKNGSPPDEKLLWHGTRVVEPQLILNSEEGFDHRCARDGMWGAGAYFATESQYSTNYAHHLIADGGSRTATGDSQIVLARVLVGESVEMQPTTETRSLRRPPNRPAQGFTSPHLLPQWAPPNASAATQGSTSPAARIEFAKESAYDSVTGYTGGSQVFIVYSHGRAYPEYLVTYER